MGWRITYYLLLVVLAPILLPMAWLGSLIDFLAEDVDYFLEKVARKGWPGEGE